mgnify:CR=1 FL=1
MALKLRGALFWKLYQAIKKVGGAIPEELTQGLLQGADEIDLVRSGLDDTMRQAFQSIRERFWSKKNISSYRTAAMGIAINKIATNLLEQGVYV